MTTLVIAALEDLSNWKASMLELLSFYLLVIYLKRLYGAQHEGIKVYFLTHLSKLDWLELLVDDIYFYSWVI